MKKSIALTVKELEKASLEIRKCLLRLCTMQVIHIGGDLSAADVMTVLWLYQMNYDPNNPKNENRDRFVLSKGHASALTSFNQAQIGCFSVEDVYNEYASDTGRFSMHSCNLINPFVEVSTGSLGHGMPIACGIAAALRMKNKDEIRVYTVMSDGEQSEGSIWEAALNAAHYELGNLVAILDFNGLEADGKVSDITGLGNIVDKYIAFGWNVVEIDGNNVAEIKNAFDSLPPANSKKPTLIACHTVKGKGVDYMENSVRWHTGKLTLQQYEEAVRVLDAGFKNKWGEDA